MNSKQRRNELKKENLKNGIKEEVKSLVGLIVLFICMSCNSDNSYTDYKTIAKEGLSTIPIIFNLPEEAIDSGIKNVFIRLRNDNSYPYANVFLIASLQAGEEQVTQDTLEYAMAASDGSLLGTGFSEVKESKLWWKEGVVFPKERPIFIKVSQAVRNNGAAEGVSNLKGILSVGISIEDQ